MQCSQQRGNGNAGMPRRLLELGLDHPSKESVFGRSFIALAVWVEGLRNAQPKILNNAVDFPKYHGYLRTSDRTERGGRDID